MFFFCTFGISTVLLCDVVYQQFEDTPTGTRKGVPLHMKADVALRKGNLLSLRGSRLFY